MDIASHLKMSLQRCQRETTSKEFVLWKVYLDEQPNRFNALHDYLAQIALEIVRGRLKDPSKVKLEDFRFKFINEKPKDDEPTEEVKQQRLSRSKGFWKALAGVGSKNKAAQNPKKKPTPQTKRKPRTRR